MSIVGCSQVIPTWKTIILHDNTHLMITQCLSFFVLCYWIVWTRWLNASSDRSWHKHFLSVNWLMGVNLTTTWMILPRFSSKEALEILPHALWWLNLHYKNRGLGIQLKSMDLYEPQNSQVERNEAKTRRKRRKTTFTDKHDGKLISVSYKHISGDYIWVSFDSLNWKWERLFFWKDTARSFPWYPRCPRP